MDLCMQHIQLSFLVIRLYFMCLHHDGYDRNTVVASILTAAF